MEKKRCPIRTHFQTAVQKLREILVIYLDDLLLIGGGGCFVAAACEYAGRPAGLAVAGAWMCILALVIARSRNGGGG